MIKLKKSGWLYRARNLGLSYRIIFIFILLSLISTITEVFGIGIFLPIFQFIRLDGSLDALVAESSLWGYAINVFSLIGMNPSLAALLLLSFSFFIIRQFFVYLRLVYGATVNNRIVQIQRNLIFSGYIDADTLYHDSTPVGDLVNVVTTEVNHAVTGVMAPMDLIVYFIMLLGYLFILSILSWEMTILSIVVLLLASRIPSAWIRKSTYTGRKLVGANTIMSEFLVGRLQSPRLVRLSGTEVAEKNEFFQLTHAQRKHSVFASILQARTEVVMEPVVVGLSLIFLYFSYTILQLSIEVIGLYLVIALRLLPVVKGIMSQWQTVQRFLGSVEVLENRLKLMQDSIEKNTGAKSINNLNHQLLIDDISYKYPDSKDNALKDITVKFEANKMTAIVGPSGSGKSTLVDLLPRLRLPSRGSILVDNVDIEKYTLKSVRNIISYAPQFPQIFNGTVKNHILYGKVDATNNDVLEAAKLAGALDFINQLPQGFDTILGDDAIKLSGGQRQRLDLARALLKKAPILILDEPTSNLDAESEEIFKQVLGKIRQDKNTTIVIVTHRLASISDADNIVVLNKGVVKESGTHLDLLNQDMWYANAWKSQE